MSSSSEQDSKESLEYESGDESSQNSLEYHSGQEPESERQQIILVNCDEEFTFLNIQFPMPQTYPHPYIQLNKLMSHVDTIVPRSYDQIQSIAGNPQCALGYIIHHFNIEKVSKELHKFPYYAVDQVYYSTYMDSTRYHTLQHYYWLTWKQLEGALAKEQLELQKNMVDTSQLMMYQSSSWIASYSGNCYDPSCHEHMLEKTPTPTPCRPAQWGGFSPRHGQLLHPSKYVGQPHLRPHHTVRHMSIQHSGPQTWRHCWEDCWNGIRWDVFRLWTEHSD